ncbi:hypothetical protein M752DRAFT_297642 [Aspergillus phoenicis ATCC 13157]|uniref:Serine hydrolase domain-containing protein n=1 Tax=Aspergillus phoenicis ATCC 13157 TaxID=1353007 RepID=A0A370P7U5_ASPPH|nr:hypothetical protein M752DRAFT_297642 [Aspergillus phoenicis ATCC 13157]
MSELIYVKPLSNEDYSMPNLLILTDFQSPALNTGEMKIPRLHPWGASAEIFEKQISLICAMISESHDYVFLDGSVSCGLQQVRRSQLPGSRPAVLGPRGYDRSLIISARDTYEMLTALPLSFFTIGSPPNLPGPFYNWYDVLSSSQVKDAHDLVKDVIEDDGSFDGVIGFSQGALLALSILYYHEVCHLDHPPPFRFAIFFCAMLSISPDPMFNAGIVAKYSKYYKQVRHYEQSDKDKTKMEELE